MDVAVVQLHVKLIIQVDESGIEGAMISWRECDSISNVVNARWSSHRKNMRGVHKTELHASHSAPIAICKENLSSESCFSAQTAYFSDDALNAPEAASLAQECESKVQRAPSN